ncbi:MAG: glycoside hydrolase family 88 protein [Hungatella sp.]|jgi:rhamnogalacturonyl hydrolase YesR|nr:glycoside hydrolase family 88 protein [Hungatella sp.]
MKYESYKASDNNYFHWAESACHVYGERDREVIALMANRFIGHNPQAPYEYRLDFTSGITCDTKGWYQFDFGSRFPQAAAGEVCYGAGNLYSHSQTVSQFQIQCCGPAVLWVNGEKVFHSTPPQEGMKSSCTFSIPLETGLNHFLLETEKTEIGFGLSLRHAQPQWQPSHFTAPLAERKGQAGFVYSAPVGRESVEASTLIDGSFEGLSWFPRQNYEASAPSCPLSRIFGKDSQGTAAAKSSFFHGDSGKVLIKGSSSQPVNIYINGNLTLEWQEGTFEKEVSLPRGKYGVILLCQKKAGQETGLAVEFQDAGGALPLCTGVKGYEGEWIYTGLFEKEIPPISHFTGMDKVYPGSNGTCYWRADLPDSFVRIFAEQELYGKWTYPCGVTLYGLLKAGEYLDRPDWLEYVQAYARMTAAVYDYSIYDKSVFGYPGVNTQLCWLTELDDCGSFGSFLLEANRRCPSKEARALADVIADYMKNRQRREKDHVFSRNDNTMWIDDMYMSIPFLCRYYQLSGKEEYLTEACRQALLFKQYFFMPDQNLMSHIVDLEYKKMNKIPWSRGNGWVVLALSELLLVLPEDHPDHTAVAGFFHEMAEGILSVQDESGMWHQILDDPSTYEEASSTSMFICALSRGIRLGILSPKLCRESILSIQRAWTGMKQRVINRKGDLYGVCQGSGCSFSRSYYQQLGWRFNDPHGIGIAILAGVEKLMLDDFLYHSYIPE